MTDKRHWAEIRCDYLDESDGFWRVDAWKTDSDAEEGKVIAYINDDDGRVLYIDPIAIVDPYVAEIIYDRICEIKSRNAEINRIITISTEHLSKGGAEYLELHAEPIPGISVYLKHDCTTNEDYGFFLYLYEVTEETEQKLRTKYPSIWQCINYAKEHDALVLCLDRDGQTVPTLDSYDW